MIRKILNGILVFILLATTTGITFHYHYCCDILIKFSVIQAPKPCCEHPEDCCRDKAVTFKLKTDYLFVSDIPDFSVSGIDLPAITSLYIEDQPSGLYSLKMPEESPPPLIGLRLAMLQQFLI